MRQAFELVELDLIGLTMSVVLASERGARANRKTSLRLLDFECQRLQARRVVTRVDAVGGDELLADLFEQGGIPVDAPQMQITAAGNDLHFILAIRDERQVERTAPQVVDENPLLVG